MSTVEVKPNAKLHELIAVRDHPDGIADVRKLAALRGGLDDKSVIVLDRAIADWSVAGVAGDLEKAFALDPFTMMAKGWSQIANVRKAVKASLGPPAKEERVALLKHDMDIKLKPRLVLTVAGVDWCDVDFELKLGLSIESAELELWGGALRAVGLGKVSGSLTVSCRGAPIPAFKRDLKFDRHYAFDPPILGGRSSC
jgi:hypothetical protein